MLPRCLRIILLSALGAVALCGARGEDLSRDAMRLLHANCLSCHSEEKQKGGLALDSREGLLRGGESGRVIAEKAEESKLLTVLAADADPHMPPKKQLSEKQIAVVRQWIEAGTPWNAEALAKASTPRVVNVSAAPESYRPVLALAMSSDGRKLAIGRRNSIVVHDLASTNFPVVRTIFAHQESVRSLAWNSAGDLLASGSYREVKVWREGELAWSTTNLNGRVTALRFTPFGGALLAGDSAIGGGGTIRVYRAESGGEISAWEGHGDSIYDLASSGDGGFIATASADKVVKLWETISQREIGQIEGHSGAAYGVAFGSNSTEVVTIGADKQLKVWDIATRESVVTIPARKDGFTVVAWSRDGKTVIAADEAGALHRYTDLKRHTGAQSSDTGDHRQIAKWTEALQALAMNEDASLIAVGAQDGTVYLVNRDGKLQHTFSPTDSGTIAATSAEAPSFVRDVLPMMAKAGCMAGSCHAKPEGQAGFKLSVFSFDPKADYDEIVKEAKGRRVFPAAPEESLLLLKPTMTVEHGGGQRIEPGSDVYQMIVAWIRDGMIYQQTNEPALLSISVEPREGTYKKKASTQLRVMAHYADKSTRDVTHLADYVANEKEIAKVTESGVLQVGELEGESVIVTRYMGFVDASRVTVPAEKTLPAERYAALPANNFIDRLSYQHFQRLGLFPSEKCTDGEFIRRATLDSIGMLPSAEEVRRFLADDSPGKRQRWIEYLLEHPAYGDYWANKWADLLRPNPDRVGVKSIFFLDQWLRDSFAENKPFDQFVREVIVAEGSNHQEGPLTIYRDRRDPPELTTMFGQLFLGVRMECAKCHHHPTEKWSQDDFYQLAAHFGAMKQKGAGLSPPISAGTESFYFAKDGRGVRHPVTDEVMKPRPLDAHDAAAEGSDPRGSLADWMTDPKNAYFAKATVNRVWAVFFGRGFVDPVDDFRISNPAVNEPLLDALAADFVEHGYDLKHLIRAIMNSRVYQLSSTPNEFNLHDTKNFSRALRRRLPAEVLLDAINDVTGVEDEFNGCPPGTRAIQTWSYKVRSHFMDAFGRPNSSSDCPCERDTRTSVVQSLHMMNSRGLQSKLADANGRVKSLAGSALKPEEIVTELYLAALSRVPSKAELETATSAFRGEKPNRQNATEDVLWALLNSPEFVFNH